MALSSLETVRRLGGTILPQAGERSPSLQSYREQRLQELRRRGLRYFGNGIDLVYNNDPQNPVAHRYKTASFLALARREKGFLIGSGVIDLFFTSQKLSEAGRPDGIHFDTSDPDVWAAYLISEWKSGRKLDIQRSLGGNSSFLERTRQRDVELLFLLQSVVPARITPPKDIVIPPHKEISVLFLGSHSEPPEEVRDPKGRFREVGYEFFPHPQVSVAA